MALDAAVGRLLPLIDGAFPTIRNHLTEAIKDAHGESGGIYGSPRVHRALRDAGQRCGRKRVARIMRRKGLVGRCPKRWRTTTEQDPDAMSTAVDLICREFGPGVEVDGRWGGEITLWVGQELVVVGRAAGWCPPVM